MGLARLGASWVDGDDFGNPGNALFEQGFEQEAQGGALAGAVDAGALKEQADGTAFVDGDDFDVSPVGHKGRADLVERHFYLVAQVLRHCDVHVAFYRPTAGLR